MNSLWNKLRTGRLFKNGSKRLALSVVILCEVIAIAAVATFAWVETVSSIKITNEANTVGLVKNDTKYTDIILSLQVTCTWRLLPVQTARHSIFQRSTIQLILPI